MAPHPLPTEQQITELAILLIHEAAHFVLSHHLETFSATIMVSTVISMFTDIAHGFLFPISLLFGLLVNVAVEVESRLES
jgi:Zn-dependent protease with chaperone function